MTHLEKFVALYKEFGINCKINSFYYSAEDGCTSYIILCNESFSYKDNKNRCTKSSKFDGYSSSYSEICFDKDGNFIGQGFWEVEKCKKRNINQFQ
jgi:hypothetical protein